MTSTAAAHRSGSSGLVVAVAGDIGVVEGQQAVGMMPTATR
jgi:hypothetical protein